LLLFDQAKSKKSPAATERNDDIVSPEYFQYQ
jgi:hypothetical protein